MRYCAPRGIKFAMCSCWWFSWAIKLEKNDIMVSDPFEWEALDPSIMGVGFIHHMRLVYLCWLTTFYALSSNLSFQLKTFQLITIDQ